MYVGHLALAFAARRAAPRTGLMALAAAACLLDLLWPLLVLAGMEEVRVAPGHTAFSALEFVRYPWSHGLLLALAWAAAFGLAWRAATGDARGAWVCAALVASHWVLDWISHVPDLPLLPGLDARAGLGLWRSVPATFAVEGALFAAGLGLYLWTTRARDWRGTVPLAVLAVVLVGTWIAGAGRPPPSALAVAVVGLASGAVYLPWLGWIDRHRTLRAARPPAPPTPESSGA